MMNVQDDSHLLILTFTSKPIPFTLLRDFQLQLTLNTHYTKDDYSLLEQGMRSSIFCLESTQPCDKWISSLQLSLKIVDDDSL